MVPVSAHTRTCTKHSRAQHTHHLTNTDPTIALAIMHTHRSGCDVRVEKHRQRDSVFFNSLHSMRSWLREPPTPQLEYFAYID